MVGTFEGSLLLSPVSAFRSRTWSRFSVWTSFSSLVSRPFRSLSLPSLASRLSLVFGLVYRPFLGKRVPDEYWDQLESEHRTWQAALRPFATKVLAHVPEPPKPPTDADLEPERKKIWDSWIVECAHRWLALSSKQRDAYCWMRKKGSGGEGAASTSGAREEDAISEYSSATGQHSDHRSAAGSEAESNLSALSELTSLSELERGLDTGT
ncbi:BQ5605_C026g10222 [Microbotryum silenes-dioicae]|uniref:BQ5605_C026g10205 protein n=1 Tax=Microbotryum silenes-dioicae TaxID=796604 RepID=A0A2X0MRH5_9BASI|nr:BQ5605_C026g10205 [Microbotryum silenes-dioicae]SGZ27931.1 BQ5605_C026g10222 [Microbotryum silenes-dioicae]